MANSEEKDPEQKENKKEYVPMSTFEANRIKKLNDEISENIEKQNMAWYNSVFG